jgi:hypothetical protein
LHSSEATTDIANFGRNQSGESESGPKSDGQTDGSYNNNQYTLEEEGCHPL